MGLRLHVLGGLRVFVDGDETSVGGPMPQRLLAILLLEQGRVVSVTRLIDVLWEGSEPPASARRTIQSLVSRLRASLGDVLVREGRGYRLPTHCWETSDAACFAALVDRALAVVPDPAQKLVLLDKALGLWHGTPCGNFAAEPAFVAAVSWLEELKVLAGDERVDALIGQNRPAMAIAELERILSDEPLRERPYELAMIAYARTGRSNDAVRTFQRYRLLLANATGLEPSAALRQLEHRILAGDIPESGPQVCRGFILGAQIGGTTSIVQRATPQEGGPGVAIKTIPFDRLANADAVRRFDFELERRSQLDHAALVPVVDWWRSAEGALIVTKWMGGGSALDRHGDPTGARAPQLATAVQIASHLAGGLDALHQAGLTHGDVALRRIFFNVEGGAVLGLPGSERLTSPLVSASPGDDVSQLGRCIASILTGTEAGSGTDVVSLLRRLRPDVSGAVALALAESAGPLQWAEQLRSAASLDTTAGHAKVRNPYKGLRTFREADRADFFGREEMIGDALDLVAESSFVAIVGPSGSGKSSVARAGVAAAVAESGLANHGGDDQAWSVASIVPGDQPLAEVEAALLRIAVNPPASLMEQLQAGRDGMRRAVLRVLPDRERRLLLVVDQLEELWTHVDDQQQRHDFLDALIHAAGGPRSPLAVLATIRADFTDRALEHPGMAECLRKGVLFLSPLSAVELERAVRGPLERLGMEVEPSLLARLSRDAADKAGALPFLQFTLRELFARRKPAEIGPNADYGGQLSAADYEALGGIAGALGNRAEEVWLDLGEGEKEAVRRLFRRLVNIGEDRRNSRHRVVVAELPNVSPIVIQRLVDERLLTADRSHGSAVVEIAHEALLSGWDRLAEWITHDKESIVALHQLSSASDIWESGGRSMDDLWRGRRLEQAAELADNNDSDLTATERMFVDASLEHREDEAGREKANRIRELVLASKEQRSNNPSGALENALDALDLDVESLDALGAVQGGLLACGPWLGDLSRGHDVVDGIWLDEETVLLRHFNGHSVWDVRSLSRTRWLPSKNPGPMTTNGSHLVIGDGDGVLTWVEKSDWSTIETCHLSTAPTALEINPNGSLVAGCSDGTVWSVGVLDTARPTYVGKLDRRVFDVAQSPDGLRVAACVGVDGQAAEWLLPSGVQRPLELPSRKAASWRGPFSVEYLDDGRLAAAIGRVIFFSADGRSLDEWEPVSTSALQGRLISRSNELWYFNGASLAGLDLADGGDRLTSAGVGMAIGAVSPAGRTALFISESRLARLQSVDQRTVLGPAVPADTARMARLDRDADWLAMSYGHDEDGNQKSTLWDLDNTSECYYEDRVWQYCVFRGGQVEPVLWRTSDRASATWHTDRRQLTDLPFSDLFYGDVELTHDGRYCIQGNWTGTIEIFDRLGGQRLLQLCDLIGTEKQSDDYSQLITDLELSPDGDSFVAANKQGRTAVWRVGTWERLGPIVEGPVLTCYSPDGSEIVTIDNDGRLASVDPETLALLRGPVELGSPPLVPGQGDGLDITADGRFVVACLTTGAQLIDYRRLEPVGDPFPHDGRLWSSCIARRAKVVATIDDDWVRLWDIDPDNWVSLAQRLTGR